MIHKLIIGFKIKDYSGIMLAKLSVIPDKAKQRSGTFWESQNQDKKFLPE